ncbi:hypothetical protein NGM37_45775, partial [Streptomyces sp. TRM76130]|nr:hypothetical protein [Streptomyces sp. TRM76130]
MSLPEGWQALAAPRAGRPSVVYAAPQRLDAAVPPPSCGTDTGATWDVFSCAPLAALDPGAVVVALEPVEGAEAAPPTGTL